MIGTYVNTGTILGGSLIGLVIGKHLPERLKTTVMQGLGLSTLLIGMQMALSGHSPITAIGCLLAGAVTGELLKIEQGVELAGEWLKAKTASDSPTFVQSFVSSSILYLSGAMMIIGIGLNFLNLTRIRIGNFIPAVLYAIVWSHFFPK